MKQAAAGDNKRVPCFCLPLTVLIIWSCRRAIVYCGIQWSVSIASRCLFSESTFTAMYTFCFELPILFL